MAKVSEKELTDIGQDWGNDGTGLPYKGSEVQKFIKGELNKRPDTEASKLIVGTELQSQLFGNGTRKIVTSIEGTSEALTITSLDSTGHEKPETINIGSPDVNDRIVTITSRLTNPYINVGGQTNLVFGFFVADYQGDAVENQLATLNVSLSRQESTQPFYTTSLGRLGSTAETGLTNHSFDLTNILADSINGSARINVTLSLEYQYHYTDEEGIDVTKTIRKSRTVVVEVISLSLNVPYNIGNINNGQVSLQYTVRGNGSKSVYLYKNGELVDSVSEITNNSYSGVFVVDVTTSANYQIVAEAMAGTTTVRSSSYYFDVLGESSGTMIAVKIEDSTGTIQSADVYKTPTISFPKFNNFSFEYFIFNSEVAQNELTISTQELSSNGDILSTQDLKQLVSREVYAYSKRIKSGNNLAIKLSTGTTQKVINVSPMESDINLDIPTESIVFNLDADGRSNSEASPDNWSYGEVSTEFSKMNWQSNGWIEDDGTALVLKNGAKAIINYPLFQYIDGQSVTRTGCTFEILFKCSNPTLDPHDIITCSWAGSQGRTTGLKITTNYVGVNTGTVTEYKDDNGNVTQSVEDAVGSQYTVDTYYKYAFVIDPNLGDNGLCLGYLNGILSFVSDIPSVFANNNGVPITIDSSYADVYVKSMKYYSKALTSDECVNDYIIDQNDLSTIEELYNKNNVFGIDSLGNTYISPSKIKAMGKGVMIISPSDAQTGDKVNIQDLNKSSDKKSYYGPFRVDYFAPEYDLNLGTASVTAKGSDFNFTHMECAIRVQGTTSTKRPRKNFRLHYNKRTKEDKPSEGSFIVGGKVNNKFKYAMSQNSVAVPISCLKVDYVDSSMTHNTGGALIYNEIVKSIPSMMNPAQLREYDGTPDSVKTRVAVEGFPIDVFAASEVINPEYTDTLDDNNYRGLVYMGQYNFNNDKSKSGKVFGFDGAYTYNEDGEYDENGEYQPVCLEFLDNTTPLDSFKVKFDTSGNINDEDTYSGFTTALEVRAPEDATDHVAGSGIDDLATSDYLKDDKGVVTTDLNTFKYIPGQVKGVFNFIGECAAEVARNNGISPSALNTYTSEQFEALDWTSAKFVAEASEHFILPNICGWYIWTDYTLAVDQRAKNMMLYTMDGKHWLLQYYDGDTMMGERNDCFLAYDYLTDRDTWDYAVKQYAFQGHDSWLWYLIRANFGDLLNTTAQVMRASGKFSPEYFKRVFNQQIVNNWSQRQYNYSQDYKYIKPLTETGYPSDIGTNFINTAQGSRQAHRDYLIDNRFALLDSKYQAGNYTSDNFLYYGADNVSSNKVTIVSSIPFYFGWNTPNTPIRERQYANADNNYTVQLNVVGNTANNPASILGASKIKELYFGATPFNAGVYMPTNVHINLQLNRKIPRGTSFRIDSMNLSSYFSEVNIFYQHDGELVGGPASSFGVSSVTPYDVDGIELQLYKSSLSSKEVLDIYNKILSGELKASFVIEYNTAWTVDQSKAITLPSLDTLIASELGANASGSLYLPNCTSLSHLDLHGSNFSGLYRMENNGKMKYLDIRDTNITNAKLADGSPVENMRLGSPSLIYLSNFDKLKYQNKSDDTFSVQSWDNLEQLVVNNCPNVNWELLVNKLKQSPSTTKWLRITGIDRTDDITWLDQFISGNGITWAGLDTEGNEVRDVQLVGHLYLPKYTNDYTVSTYQAKFPNLVIHQPEYTIIETDETVGDETPLSRQIAGSTTNLDNNTGYRTSTLFTPSGHISKILNSCHRYLGKVITPGDEVMVTGIATDTNPRGKEFMTRKNNGTMLVCQLSDSDSTFFNEGYNSSNRRAASLDGLKGHGEVYVKIPGFWYKGVNYNPAEAHMAKSFRYTCYSSSVEKPSVSSEITVLPIGEVMDASVEAGSANGLYRLAALVDSTGNADTITDRIADSGRHDVVRISVSGYKKVRFPAAVGTTACSVFTDTNGSVITDSEGDVANYGELLISSGNWLYDGMYVIATIPSNAAYLYISVPRYIGTTGMVSCEPSDIVLHKGSKFASGSDMNDSNAKEWIADMEPEWIDSDTVCIGAAPCSDDGQGSLYTSFDGTTPPARGTKNQENSLASRAQWFQYSMMCTAAERGLQLIDYEATKLIAMLFMAKYGRRNSQNELGWGASEGAYTGLTRTYGMADTVAIASSNNSSFISSGGNYINVNHATFLGIEDIHAGVGQWLDRAYYVNDSPSVLGKIRITNPDLTERKLFSYNPSGNYVKSVVHGKYCDIVSCSLQGGSSTTFYPDNQIVDNTSRTTWSTVRAILRSRWYEGSWYPNFGVFLLGGSFSVGLSGPADGSRLIFRGNIIETTDIDEFLGTEEYRGVV